MQFSASIFRHKKYRLGAAAALGGLLLLKLLGLLFKFSHDGTVFVAVLGQLITEFIPGEFTLPQRVLKHTLFPVELVHGFFELCDCIGVNGLQLFHSLQ